MRLPHVKYILIYFLLSLTPSVSQEYTAVDQEMERALNEIIAHSVPGISVAVSNKDGVIWSGTAGYSSYENNNPTSQSHLFAAGNISNYYIAAVLIQMAEDKIIDLNVTPQSILGDVVSEIENADTATLYQLLNHTSGIYSWTNDRSWKRRGRGVQMNPKYRWGKEEALKYITKNRHSATNAPGVAYAFSASNYAILSLIIEKVSEGVIEDQIRIRILEPLGLKDTYYDTYEVAPYGQLIDSYHVATNEFISQVGINVKFDFGLDNYINTSGASLSAEGLGGGIITTPRDLALFSTALRNGKIIKQSSLNYLSQSIGDNAIGIHSNILGFTTDLRWLDQDLSVVSFINLGSVNNGEDQMSDYLNSLMDKILLPIAKKYAK